MKLHRFFYFATLWFALAEWIFAGDSRIELITIESRALGIPKNFNLYLPQDYDEAIDDHYPVVYLFRGHEREWVNPDEDGSRNGRMIKDVADELFAAGEIGKMILVMPGLSSEDNAVPAWSVNFLEPERLGTKPGIGSGQFEDYLIEELVPFVDANYRTLPSRSKRGLDGFSFGGTASMMVATRHPELFCSVGSFDGTLVFLNNGAQGSGIGQDFFAADFTDAHFGVPRNVEYMRSYIPANGIRYLENDRLPEILGMQFLIRTLATAGNRFRAEHYLDLMAEQGIENGFADITLAQNAQHNWFWADRHVAQTLPRHWQRFQNPVEIISVQLLSPAEGAELAGQTEIRWSTDADPGEVTSQIFVNDGGSFWSPVDSMLKSNSYTWNTSDFQDATNYRIRVVVRSDSVLGARQNDGVFTINNPGNGRPAAMLISPIGDEFISGAFAIRWQASDPEGDALNISLDLMADEQVFPIAANLPNTGEYLWDSALSANRESAILRLRCSDGMETAEDFSTRFEIFNQRAEIPASQVQHISGNGNAVIAPQVIDPTQLTGHVYRITFDDSTSELKTYDVLDVDTGMMVVTAGSALDGTSEGPAFDGIRLIIKDFDPAEPDEQNSGWLGNSTLGFDILTRTVLIDGQQRTGIPWPSDYEIELFDSVVDTSTSEFGLTPKPIKFTITNLTEDRRIDLIFSEFIAPDSSISDVDTITLIEPDENGEPQLAWSINFRGSQGHVPPSPGDRFFVRTLKPVTSQDVFEIRTTPTFVNDETVQIPQDVVLYPNYPNPFNPQTTIGYSLPRAKHVRLTVYNLVGQALITLVNEVQKAGKHTVNWDSKNRHGTPVASGVYFYKMTAGSTRRVGKMLLVR